MKKPVGARSRYRAYVDQAKARLLTKEIHFDIMRTQDTENIKAYEKGDKK